MLSRHSQECVNGSSAKTLRRSTVKRANGGQNIGDDKKSNKHHKHDHRTNWVLFRTHVALGSGGDNDDVQSNHDGNRKGWHSCFELS